MLPIPIPILVEVTHLLFGSIVWSPCAVQLGYSTPLSRLEGWSSCCQCYLRSHNYDSYGHGGHDVHSDNEESKYDEDADVSDDQVDLVTRWGGVRKKNGTPEYRLFQIQLKPLTIFITILIMLIMIIATMIISNQPMTLLILLIMIIVIITITIIIMKMPCDRSFSVACWLPFLLLLLLWLPWPELRWIDAKSYCY